MARRRTARTSDPLVTAGPVAAPVVRTGLQVTAGAFLVQGIDVFAPDLLTGDQAVWLAGALTLGLSWLQNQLESWKGRRLIGATP